MAGQSRKEFYAQLGSHPHRYDRQGFDSSSVYTYLRAVVVAGKVGKKGGFNFYAQNVYLGQGYRNQPITLRYEVQNHCFSIKEASNTIIAHLKADNFSEQNILNLCVCQNR